MVTFFKTEHLQPWDLFLAQSTGLNLNEIYELSHFGAIYKNQTRYFGTPHELANPNDLFRVHLKPKKFSTEQLSKVYIISNTPEWVAIFKPCGISSHESLDNYWQNAKAQAKKLTNTELWGLSRLDIATSGVLLLAKSKDFAKYYNQQLTQHSVEKVYYAIAPHFSPTSDVLKHYMYKSPRAPKTLITVNDYEHLPDQKKSEYLLCELKILSSQPTHIMQSNWDNNYLSGPDYSLGKIKNFYLYKIKLVTGRTHQIRAQLAFENAPIWGDTLYGSKHPRPPQPYEDIALHCYGLTFTSSKDETVSIYSSPPSWAELSGD